MAGSSMADTGPPPLRWVSLAAICTAAGMVWLAFGDLGVALPVIADEFTVSLSTLQCGRAAWRGPRRNEDARSGRPPGSRARTVRTGSG
ncbi:hypothetical protein ACFY4C_16620 [Actinomadura viridis]|uniref:hypothetical protein n=1 Tax=Actinomadura viridis TaxID=58110 RepID=UPI0036A54DCD